MTQLKDQVWQTLKTIPYPGYSRDLVSFGLVQQVNVRENTVTVSLAIDHLTPETQQQIVTAVREALRRLPEVQTVRVEIGQLPSLRPQPDQVSVPRTTLQKILAVGSGKGGVGKSTVAVNLAVALAQQGFRVGLLDADVYGPNVPRMLGIDHPLVRRDKKIIPAKVHGVQVVSIGCLIKIDTPVVWRGPMADKLIRQFLTGVAWDRREVLVVDLPPGTGDVAISLAHYARPDGAIVVVTPQDVALDDARKAVGMFRKLEVPILGIVENMSYFVCTTCETRHDLFGQGGGKQLAEILDLPFLGEIPLEPAVRAGGDTGIPAVLQADSRAGTALRIIAEKITPSLCAHGNSITKNLSPATGGNNDE